MRLRMLFVFLFAVSANAAPMYRVVRIIDETTIVVEHDAVQTQVHLAGIEVTDRENAIAYLKWSIGSTWVMVENGNVYRSPDALLINEAMVRKGFARAIDGSELAAPRVHAEYLGDLYLGKRETPRTPAAKVPSRAATTARRLRARQSAPTTAAPSRQ